MISLKFSGEFDGFLATSKGKLLYKTARATESLCGRARFFRVFFNITGGLLWD